jgi:uncharacterized membrane protein
MSNQSINVSFKVAGSELSSYINSIQKKSDELANSAIKAAVEQSKKAKEQLSIINQTIAAIERKTRIETQAARSIILEKRETALDKNRELFEGRKNEIFSNSKLTEDQKKEKVTALSGSEKENELRIKNEYRDNLTVLREQERQAKLQTQLSKEQIDTLKQTAKENVRAISAGDMKLVDVINNAQTDDQKLIAKLSEEELSAERKRKYREDKNEGGQATGLAASMFIPDNFNKGVSSLSQLTQTQNGADVLQSLDTIKGNVVGSVLGMIAGAFVGNPVAGAAAGGAAGSALGSFFGGLNQREVMTKDAYLKAKNKYSATTGRDESNTNVYSTEKAGVGITEYLQLQSEIAKKRGSALDSAITTRDAIYAERGYGVGKEVSMALVELQRSLKDENKGLAGLIGGVIEKGQERFFKNGDHTMLPEVLNKFTALSKELLKTQSAIKSGTPLDIIKQFDTLGGEWSAKDYRSQGLINSVNSSLINPNTDFKKALSFYTLRRNNPNIGLADIIEEQEKGLGSSKYFRSMMQMITGMGGDDNSQRLNVAGYFGLEGNQAAATKILRGYQKGKFKNFDTSELNKVAGLDFQDKAERNTTTLEVQSAHIENGILSGNAISSMTDAVREALQTGLSGAVIEMKDGNRIRLNTQSQVITKNVTRTAASNKRQQRYAAEHVYNGSNMGNVMLNNGMQ